MCLPNHLRITRHITYVGSLIWLHFLWNQESFPNGYVYIRKVNSEINSCIHISVVFYYCPHFMNGKVQFGQHLGHCLYGNTSILRSNPLLPSPITQAPKATLGVTESYLTLFPSHNQWVQREASIQTEPVVALFSLPNHQPHQN